MENRGISVKEITQNAKNTSDNSLPENCHFH